VDKRPRNSYTTKAESESLCNKDTSLGTVGNCDVSGYTL
jgi:hypothetical protein